MKKCKYCQSEIDDKAKICPVCKKKQNKIPLFFRLLIGIPVLIIGITVLTQNTSVPTSQSATNKINIEKFNTIQTGMTYQEVVNIIGEEGTMMSESNIGNDETYRTILYYWYGDNGISNANIMFQNNKVISKAQIGL